MQLLLEPFSAALENDLRLREMAALREAAEADKRSLLTRLGRKTLGDTIVGVESGLRAVMERVELVARSDAPVLIFGETGTGKELVARAIHNRSPRHSGPFDRVNCGAIPPELIDSQLFGHERARSPARSRPAAAGSSGPTAARCFSTRSANCLRRPRSACCASCRTAGWSASAARSRSTLTCGSSPPRTAIWPRWWPKDGSARICGIGSRCFPIVLPPLRERREDIARLALHFAERAATRFGLAPAAPTPEDLTLLASYSWPGNVRELGAVIDRAAILGDGKRLDVAKALGIGADSSGAALEIERPRPPSRRPSGPIEPLNEAIRRHIEAALAAARAASKAGKAPPRCCKSIPTLCGRRCASWASIGPASATTNDRREKMPSCV